MTLRPSSISETQTTIGYGGQNRLPGREGNNIEFYKSSGFSYRATYAQFSTQCFFEGATTPQQKAGIIVCQPKPSQMLTPADRRPITP